MPIQLARLRRLPGKPEVFARPPLEGPTGCFNNHWEFPLHPCNLCFDLGKAAGKHIMDYRPRRAMSPGSRRIARGESSSTGMLIFPSAFDQYQGPSRSSTAFTSGPRTSAERLGPPRVVPRYRHESPPRNSSRDDYVVRPRRQTLTVPTPPAPRPLSLFSPSSPSRIRPIITSTFEKPPSPSALATRPRRDEDYYLLPSSSTSRREPDRNYTYEGSRQARDRWEHGLYRRPGNITGAYHTDPPYVRPNVPDEWGPGYEYTNRREQVYRDTAPRLRTRRESDSGRRERASSMAELENYPSRINPASRDPGPPITLETRGFHPGERTGLDRSGSLGKSHRKPENEPPRDYIRAQYDVSQPRKSSHVPVVHQEQPENFSTRRREVKDATEAQSRKYDTSSNPEPRKDTDRTDHLDEQYGRTTDDRFTRYHDRKPHRSHEREDQDHHRTHERKDRDHHRSHDREDRDHHRSHDREGRDYHRGYEREDRDHRVKEDVRARGQESGQEISENGLIALTAASAAGAGVVADSSRSRHHRHDRQKDDDDPTKERTRVDDRGHRTKREDSQKEGSSSDTTEDSGDEKRERHERHRRHPATREDKELEAQRETEALPPSDGNADDGLSRENPTPKELPQIEAPPRSGDRHHHHYSHTQEKDSFSEDSHNSEPREPRDALEKRKRQVRVVTPSEDLREPEQPIKGILRPPREKFPEDPAPVREGVAPLNKKGIPPNARWTKIDRRLVNPEALVAGNERYEERPEYVIVLRVLTKEEIEAYALKTQEIRAKRGYPPNVHEPR